MLVIEILGCLVQHFVLSCMWCKRISLAAYKGEDGCICQWQNFTDRIFILGVNMLRIWIRTQLSSFQLLVMNMLTQQPSGQFQMQHRCKHITTTNVTRAKPQQKKKRKRDCKVLHYPMIRIFDKYHRASNMKCDWWNILVITGKMMVVKIMVKILSDVSN